MSTRRGMNPCLICGGLTSGPKGGVVCGECRRKVDDYDQLRGRYLAEQVAIRVRQYPYVPGRSKSAAGPNARHVLDDLLRELRAATEPVRRKGWTSLASGETATDADKAGIKPRVIGAAIDHAMTINVPRNLAQFLLDLEPAIYHAVNEAEEDGRRQGTNLLAQLAAGNLTSDEFERKAGIKPA